MSHADAIRRLDRARSRALALMTELGRQELDEPLQDRGWSFGFDRAKRRMGCCRWNGKDVKRITLSIHFVARNDLEALDDDGISVLDDLIRHEIAHAIDYETRGTSDHGPRWRAICRRIGASPTARYDGDDVEGPPARYVARCPHCGAGTEYYHRPRRAAACSACCDQYNGGRYTERFRLVVEDRKMGRNVGYAAAERPRPVTQNVSPAAQGFKYTATCPRCGYQTGYRRKLKRSRACKHCCDKYADGRFDSRFELQIEQNY